MATSIPVVDLSGAFDSEAGARHAAATIDAICRETGFFTITNHGVSSAAMGDLREEAHAFFARPLAGKLRVAPADLRTPRGYRALGLEALSSANDIATPPDLKEFYHIGREDWPDEPYYRSGEGPNYFIPNIWPADQPGFSRAAARYYGEVEQLAARMMGLTAIALGQPQTFFADKIDRHITAMRLNFYPEQTSPPKLGQLRAGDHTDYGVFTILNGENVPGGLQVKTRGGAWIDVETDPDTFVVNIGDLLMRWTNDRWVSNVHRVVNPPDGVAARSKRLSIAFFQHPNYDALIECVAPPGEAKYPPVQSGAYRARKYAQTHVTPRA